MQGNDTIKQAKEIYEMWCNLLDEKDWPYEEDIKHLTLTCTVKGDDLPIPVAIIVATHPTITAIYSHLPFSISENRREAISMATCMANKKIYTGCFSIKHDSNILVYRLSHDYNINPINKEILNDMLMTSCCMVDMFNDKFFIINKKKISINEMFDLMDEEE